MSYIVNIFRAFYCTWRSLTFFTCLYPEPYESDSSPS